MKSFVLVENLHRKFDMPQPNNPSLLPDDLLKFRLKFLREEIDEFEKAHKDNDLAEAFDAMLDLLYVLHGTLYFMGIDKYTLMQGFHEVHKANMQKEKVESVNESKRGHPFDLKKPINWKPPNHKKILGIK